MVLQKQKILEIVFVLAEVKLCSWRENDKEKARARQSPWEKERGALGDEGWWWGNMNAHILSALVSAVGLRQAADVERSACWEIMQMKRWRL